MYISYNFLYIWQFILKKCGKFFSMPIVHNSIFFPNKNNNHMITLTKSLN